MRAETQGRFGRGIAWVLRRIAKPLEKGSIPSPASILLRPRYNQKWLSSGHRFQLGQAFSAWLLKNRPGAFAAGMRHGYRFSGEVASEDVIAAMRKSERLMMDKHDELVRAMTELSNLKDKHIAVSKELSKLKRAAR